MTPHTATTKSTSIHNLFTARFHPFIFSSFPLIRYLLSPLPLKNRLEIFRTRQVNLPHWQILPAIKKFQVFEFS
jgi:hypothetical protein